MNGKDLRGHELFVDAARQNRRDNFRKSRYSPRRSDPQCSFCGKPGH